jgi:tol-pal system protein YbgF
MRNFTGIARSRKRLLLVSILGLSLLGVGCATRQQYTNLESGIAELKEENDEIAREIDSLREMIRAEHDLIQSTKADILAEISGIREQLFLMENRLTEGGGETFLEFTTPVEEGIRVEEGEITPPPPTDAEAGKVGGDLSAGVREGQTSEEDRVTYDTAFLDMTRGKYELAIEGYRSFISGGSRSQLRDNAQYWIGECYYALGDLRRAIEEFQLVVDDYPRGNKIPSALFKIGKCYFELGDSDAARRYFRSVVDGYPRSEEANLAREYLTEL